MTERFESAADLMRQVLGAPAHPFVQIPHPVSSATREELRVAAIAAADACAAIIAPAS